MKSIFYTLLIAFTISSIPSFGQKKFSEGTISYDIVILKEFGEQKYMITLTPNDWKDANKKYEGISFTYDPSAEKVLQGYNCKKAIGTLQDGTTYTVWYTPDLVPENKNFQYETRSLPGLALEYEINSKDQKVTYTVSKISFSPVLASKFDLPK